MTLFSNFGDVLDKAKNIIQGDKLQKQNRLNSEIKEINKNLVKLSGLDSQKKNIIDNIYLKDLFKSELKIKHLNIKIYNNDEIVDKLQKMYPNIKDINTSKLPDNLDQYLLIKIPYKSHSAQTMTGQKTISVPANTNLKNIQFIKSNNKRHTMNNVKDKGDILLFEKYFHINDFNQKDKLIEDIATRLGYFYNGNINHGKISNDNKNDGEIDYGSDSLLVLIKFPKNNYSKETIVEGLDEYNYINYILQNYNLTNEDIDNKINKNKELILIEQNKYNIKMKIFNILKNISMILTILLIFIIGYYSIGKTHINKIINDTLNVKKKSSNNTKNMTKNTFTKKPNYIKNKYSN